jgi:hypothetical protein
MVEPQALEQNTSDADLEERESWAEAMGSEKACKSVEACSLAYTIRVTEDRGREALSPNQSYVRRTQECESVGRG